MKAEKKYAFTRKELMSAFRRWNKSALKTNDGKRYIDNEIVKPSVAADTLIKHLVK